MLVIFVEVRNLSRQVPLGKKIREEFITEHSVKVGVGSDWDLSQHDISMPNH